MAAFTKTLSPKAQEVFDNCGFRFLGTDGAGRDAYECVRETRDGAPCRRQSYRLTVIAGRFCASCDCPEGCRQKRAGDGVLCKHAHALEFWLADGAVPVIVPVAVQPEELTFVTKPAPSGWEAVCGL